MKNQEIKFQNNSEKYSIFIGEKSINLLPNKIKTLCPETQKIGVIIDKNIPSKYKQILKKKLKGYDVSFLPFLANEKNKTLKKSKNRPVLGKDKADDSIKKIYFIRKKFYNKADYRIKCKTLTLKQIIEKILNFYEKSRN